MSAQLNLLEKQISLFNSTNEEQGKDIRLMNEMINRINTIVDLKNFELETKMMSNNIITVL